MSSSEEWSDTAWIQSRLNKDTNPKYIILSRNLHEHSEPTLTLHTAGQTVVWEIAIREAAQNQEILSGMGENDRKLVQWLYGNDFDIPLYHYP